MATIYIVEAEVDWASYSPVKAFTHEFLANCFIDECNNYEGDKENHPAGSGYYAADEFTVTECELESD